MDIPVGNYLRDNDGFHNPLKKKAGSFPGIQKGWHWGASWALYIPITIKKSWKKSPLSVNYWQKSYKIWGFWGYMLGLQPNFIQFLWFLVMFDIIWDGFNLDQQKNIPIQLSRREPLATRRSEETPLKGWPPGGWTLRTIQVLLMWNRKFWDSSWSLLLMEEIFAPPGMYETL